MHIRFMGQWGNQMFQYVLGCILHERTGQAYIPPGGWRNKHGAALRWSRRPYLMPRAHNGSQPSGAEQRIRFDHWIDLDAIDPRRPINVEHGYFQRYELIRPWKDRIRNDWLKLTTPLVETDSETVYVHCRLTDYVIGQGGILGRNGVATTIEEYRRCLQEFPEAKRLVICTDDPQSPFHEQFKMLGLPYTVTGDTWDGDFLTLASCRWLLISQSTYSWWAGFLGAAERIVCPIGAGTLWALGENRYGPPQPGEADWVNLYPDDEPARWRWVHT